MLKLHWIKLEWRESQKTSSLDNRKLNITGNQLFVGLERHCPFLLHELIYNRIKRNSCLSLDCITCKYTVGLNVHEEAHDSYTSIHMSYCFIYKQHFLYILHFQVTIQHKPYDLFRQKVNLKFRFKYFLLYLSSPVKHQSEFRTIKTYYCSPCIETSFKIYESLALSFIAV